MKKSVKPFPKPLSLKKIIGPSFVILALGLGSGEVVLWPYLAANFGLGIAWGAILGITFQYFINMEIERYALVKGESVFVGLGKLIRWIPVWFIFSTFIGFGLPGIIAASAQAFSALFGWEVFRWTAICFLILIGLILSTGKTVYILMEKITKTIILLGVPFIFVLTLVLSSKSDWLSLAHGIIGQGSDYNFLPEGIALAAFLAAFAYSGAGGNLNLTQSIYVKEKGYGMGKYADKLASLFRHGQSKDFHLDGVEFTDNEEARKNFKTWWKRMSLEHAIVFWFIGGLSILLLMLLSFTTTFGVSENKEGIIFLLHEGYQIGQHLIPAVGTAFLFVVSIMLFQTQLGVMDSTSRIMSENAAILQHNKSKNKPINLSKIYYIFLWAQIAFGVILFLFNITEPKSLLILAACLNAVAMFVHIGLVFALNHLRLPKFYRPSIWRKILLIGIFLFFGFFSTVVLISNL